MKLKFSSRIVFVTFFYLTTINLAFSQNFTLKSFTFPGEAYFSYNRAFFVDAGTVWYGSDQGIDRLNISTWNLLPPLTGMDVDSITFIRKDTQNRIWIMGYSGSAPDGYGIAIQNGDSWKHFFMNQFQSKEFLDVSGNAIWMRYGEGGLMKITSSDTVTYSDPTLDWIYEIEYDPGSGFWGKSYNQIFKLSDTGVWESDTVFSSNDVRDLYIDDQGTKWVIQSNAIWNRIDGSSNVYKPVWCPLLGNSDLQSVTSDKLGNFYFGTSNNGIIVKTKEGWYQLDITSGLPFNSVMDIQVDENNNVWVLNEGYLKVGTNYRYANAVTALLNNGFPEDGELLHGIIFSDINNNGQQDVEEPGIPNQMVKLEPSNTYVISNAEGKFSFHPANGANKISAQLKGFWQQGSTPLEYTFTYPNTSLPDFKIGLKWGIVKDMSVSLVGNALRPGFNTNYYFSATNAGSVTASTTLSFDYDPILTFVSSSVTPSIAQSGHIEWPINNLKALQSSNVQALFNLPASATLGTVIKNAASVEALSEEVELENNLDSVKTTVTGSFDPNDKLVAEGIREERYVEMDSKLTYTIRFQNTGTDTAFVVKIKDQIDTHLDITSLEILASSHTMDYSLDGRLLRFSFPNIKLPDDTHNEPKSHGYVRYRIKPPSATVGNTVVVNSAAIYFDFNEPVLTNEVKNTFVDELPDDEILRVEEISSNNMFYPNPVRDNTIHLTDEANRFMQAELISLQGTSLQKFNLQKDSIQLQLETVPSGMYLLKLTDQQKKTVLRKIIISQ